MNKKLNELYLELIKFPDSPKVYRDLKEYYAEIGKPYEAKAFEYLLSTRHNEIPTLNDYSSNTDKKQ
jgi:hypothetical protein